MMFELVTLPFSGQKEQAHLITVVLSTVFAVLIVLLNQGLTNRRAKNERTILKLEELTTAVHNVMSMGKAINQAKRKDRQYSDSEDKLNEYCIEIEKTCSLYFHYCPINTDIKEDILYQRIKEVNGHKVSPLGAGFTADDYFANKYLLGCWFNYADNILKQLRKKHIK